MFPRPPIVEAPKAMLKRYLFLPLLVLVQVLAVNLIAMPQKSAPIEVSSSRLVVKLAGATDANQAEIGFGIQGLSIRKKYSSGSLSGLYVLEKNTTTATTDIVPLSDYPLQPLIDSMMATGKYEYVEPDYVVRAEVSVPTDTSYVNGSLWGLNNTGQDNGKSDVDIDAPEAWGEIPSGTSSDIIVAVIDSGVDFNHVDLANQMWQNPAVNSSDPTFHGYNAIDPASPPLDDAGHGTHVAGTIAAEANGGGDVVGVAWNVKIMACKFLSSAGYGFTSDAVNCIYFAVDHGARVINNSWGGGGYSQSLESAIQYAADHDVLFVAAAGNEANNNDVSITYPAGYEIGNIVSVAAIDRKGNLADFSNYGSNTVHLGAPGVDIYSTFNDSDTSYAYLSGTSMASPHVAGVAALVLTQNPELSVADLRNVILNTTKPLASLTSKTLTGGMVDAYNALNAKGDGALEINVRHSGSSTLVTGATVDFYARVSDIVSITGADVSGSGTGLPSINFSDDGVSPDITANDGIYTARLTVPSGISVFGLTVNAEKSGEFSPGKSWVGKTVVLSFPVVSSPSNDNFVDAYALPLGTLDGDSVTASGNNLGATKEDGEPDHALNAGGHSIWWKWTAPDDGLVTLSTSGSDFDTLLAIYTSGPSDWAETASNDDEGSSVTSKAIFAANAGVTYYIAVDGYNGAYGNVKLSLSLATATDAPANDNFADSIELVGPVLVTSGYNLNATKEAGEISQGHTSVWWNWTASSDGEVTIDLSGSTFDTLLSVFSGDTVSSSPIKTNDNAASNVVTSALTFTATAGTKYSIQVDGKRGAMGQIRLSLNLAGTNAVPGNDNFSNASDVGGGATVSGFNNNATRETDEPYHDFNLGGHSVWWKWTPSSDGLASVSTAGSTFRTLLSVYTGSTVNSLTRVLDGTQIDGDLNGREGIFNTVANETYYIAVDGENSGFGAGFGAIQLAVKPISVSAAPNDNFSDATVVTLSSFAYKIEQTNLGATKETDEPDHAGNSGGASVWWKYTPTSAGLVTIKTAGSSFDTTLAVYTGTELSKLTPVVSNDDYNGLQSRVQFYVNPDDQKDYYIAVDGYQGATGVISFGFRLDPSFQLPPNDDFENRVLLTGNKIQVTGYNIGATLQTNEPSHASREGGSSVWWTWTAPDDGYIILNTGYDVGADGQYDFTTESSDFDTIIAVYTGSNLYGLKSERNDDDGGYRNTSMLTLIVTKGTEYQIALDGYLGAIGNYVLKLNFNTNLPTPTNDNFANRIGLSGTYAYTKGNNFGATKEDGEPLHAGSSGGVSVWWTWTAPSSGPVTIRTYGSSFNTLLGVYTGDSVDALTKIASNDDYDFSNYSSVTFDAEANVVYQIAVDGVNGDYGSVVLEIATPPANDNLANAIALSGAQVSTTGHNVGATLEDGEPDHVYQGYPGERSVWWTWTAAETGPVDISTAGSLFDTMLAVYTGTGYADFVQVASNDEAAADHTSEVRFQATKDTVYWIVVDGFFGDQGQIALTIDGTVPSKPVFDVQPADISSVVGGAAGFSVTVSGSPDITYQWQVASAGSSNFNNIVIGTQSNGAIYALDDSGAALTITNIVNTMDGLNYRCLATNYLGTTASDSATLYLAYTYDYWVSENGLSGSDADRLAVLGPDLSTNLLKFALGVGAHESVPVESIQFNFDADSGTATLSYRRPSIRYGITYSVQRSTDLSNWTDLGAGVVTTADTGSGYETYTQSDSPADTRVFYRLKISDN